MRFEELNLGYRMNSANHKLLAILAGCAEEMTVAELRRAVGTTTTAARIREVLQSMGEQRVVRKVGADSWCITDIGLNANLVYGPPAKGTICVRSPKEKLQEVFIRATYKGSELGDNCVRPGAYDALKLPSRFGNKLHYRDGSVADVN